MEAVKGICYYIPKEEKLIEWLEEMGEEFRLYCCCLSPALILTSRILQLAHKYLL